MKKPASGADHTQVLALFANFFVAVAIILLNKQIFVHLDWSYPTTLTLIHYICTFIGLHLCLRRGVFQWRAPPKTLSFLLLVILTALGPLLSNIGLRWNSVGFAQLSKVVVTPAVVLLNRILYAKAVSTRRKLALIVITCGSVLASVSDVQMNFLGTCVAVTLIPVAGLYKIAWSRWQKGLPPPGARPGEVTDRPWGAMQLLYVALPPAAVIIAAFIPLLDPIYTSTAMLRPGERQTTGLLDYQLTLTRVLLLLISGALAFLINWTAMWVLGITSALTHVLLGQLKMCVLILSSAFFFGSVPSFKSMVGAAIVIVSMLYYTRVNLEEEAARKAAATAATTTGMERAESASEKKGGLDLAAMRETPAAVSGRN